jgi:hypothetical protein
MRTSQIAIFPKNKKLNMAIVKSKRAVTQEEDISSK